MKKTIVFCVVGMLAVSAQAAIYDFNGLTPNANINGQDNWTGNNNIKSNTAPQGGAPHPGDGLCASTYGGTSVFAVTRTNDAAWNYDVSSGQPFYVEANTSVDYGTSGYYGHCKIGLSDSVTGRTIEMGYEVLPWYYAPLIEDAAGTEINGGAPRPTGQNQGPFTWRMEVDPLALGGQGEAKLLLRKDYLGETVFTEVSGLGSVSLRLADFGMTAASFDGICISIKTRLGAIDNVKVGIIPEPATMSLLALGGVGLLLRRRRR